MRTSSFFQHLRKRFLWTGLRSKVIVVFCSHIPLFPSMLRKPVGASWPKQFLARHHNLKVEVTTGLEKVHTKALNKPAVDNFFDKLTKLIEEFNITPENMYNMDE